MLRLALSLFAFVMTMPAEARGSAAPLAPGRYCVREPLVGDTGRDTFPLGEFWMIVDVVRHGGRYIVHFSNAMPDNQQVLMGGGPASVMRNGVLRFRFEDGWGNRGEGRLDSRGRVTLRMTRPGPDLISRNIGRNYGEFRVRRSGCNARDLLLRLPPG